MFIYGVVILVHTYYVDDFCDVGILFSLDILALCDQVTFCCRCSRQPPRCCNVSRLFLYDFSGFIRIDVC